MFRLGTGKPIPQDQAIVYDFMPARIGDQFRTDGTLRKMLLREAPVQAPSMLQTDAYETLGMRYLQSGDIMPAMECYRIATASRTGFITTIGSLKGAVLLSQVERRHMKSSSRLERELMTELRTQQQPYDLDAYSAWIEQLRDASQEWKRLNRESYGSREYVEACLRIGEYEEAFYSAEDLKEPGLVKKVRRATPKEMLDLEFLNHYLQENFPESRIAPPRAGGDAGQPVINH
ncbi:MAG: hypothetical protein KJ709_05035 [Nanoarchaeota archaeon]|nr:hypothetical protein [Nanoarchaeota archaeon]